MAVILVATLSFAAGQSTAGSEETLTQGDIERLDAKVREFLDVTGAEDVARSAFEQTLSAMKDMPGLPPGSIDAFGEAADVSAMVELSVPFYRKHLAEPTINGALKFAKTPEGRRYFMGQPKILAESMAAGQEYGQQLAVEVMETLGR
ncbi:MAG: DUF2059 domain-containing protein [Planctomycetota bacterium]